MMDKEEQEGMPQKEYERLMKRLEEEFEVIP